MSDVTGWVYVVDDDGDLASSVARMLKRQGFAAKAFDDPRAFLDDAAAVAGPCCVISDMMMGDINGFDLARQFRRSIPAAAIIFMTIWPRTRDAVEAIRDLGGLDYLEKPLDQDRLTVAVAQGLAWSGAKHEAALRLAPLSPRERQIFSLLVRGRTNKTVAAELGLSIKTVEDHRAAIMRKTGANSLARLIDLSL